eukprot:jgi/Tetstr1/462235/TSEL_000634.t1
MGWSLSPYYFTTFAMTFVKHMRSPTIPAAPDNVPLSRRWLRRGRWRGARNLPYVDHFLLFASSEPEALELRQRVANLLDSLGLPRHPAKGQWEPSLAWRAQYMYLAIPAARFYLRELHDVVGFKRGGRVRMVHPLRRDLHPPCRLCPTAALSTARRGDAAYVHCDSSGYGWGAVLNARLEARGSITWKDLKAVRLAVESFLPHLAGRSYVKAARPLPLWPLAERARRATICPERRAGQ